MKYVILQFQSSEWNEVFTARSIIKSSTFFMLIVLSNSKIGACKFFKIQIFRFQQAVNEVKMIQAHINLLVCICAYVVYLVIDQNEYGVEFF